MEFKWIVVIITIWIIVSLLVGFVEAAMLGGDIDPMTGEPTQPGVLNTLMNSKITSLAFWGAVMAMATFHFPAIFYGGYVILQWIFFVPIFAAFLIMMAGYIASHIPVIGRGS
jgi:hypothetical protein